MAKSFSWHIYGEEVKGPFVIGVDLGGTKMAIGAVSLKPESKIIKRVEIPTFAKGETLLETQTERSDFLKRMAFKVKELVDEVIVENKDLTFIGRVGLGSPGNILDGVIKAGTTPQLGPAMDDFNIQEGLERALKEVFPSGAIKAVAARNDALAQMACSVAELMADTKYSSKLLGERVAYVGPGTGLGGGIGKIVGTTTATTGSYRLEFFTDGHIGDIIMGYHDDKERTPAWAEFDYLSGIYIAKKTGGLTGKDLAQNLDQHRHFVMELGVNLGKIIEKIYLGDVYKARATTMWSDADRLSVKGTRYYVIGGSIGTRGEMGSIIREQALLYLSGRISNHNIELIPVALDSADAGILGAAQFVASSDL